MLVLDAMTDAGSAGAADWEALLARLLRELPPSRASRLVAEVTGASRKEVYRRALELGGGEEAGGEAGD